MKILFTADYHIKIGQKDVPAAWAKNRFREMFKQVWGMEPKSNGIHIVGGDIFDKLPNMEELELFFEFVAGCGIPTYIYDGNHEATKKGHTFLSSLKEVVRLINNKVQIIDDYHSFEEDGIDIIPYCKLKEYHPADIDFHGRILCTHVRGEIPPHVKPEVNLDIFSRWDVVLAGDLHSYDNCQRNILYPGSPVTTSFHRTKVDTGAIILDSDTLEHVFVKFKLPQLIKKTVKAGEELVPGDYDHIMYEVEGDMSTLAALETTDSTLVAKKIVNRSSEAALILDPGMSMAEELSEYLRYVLTLEDSAVEDLLKIFKDHYKDE